MPKVIRKLIVRKLQLWEKINDSDSLNSYLAAYDDVKRSIQQIIKRQELELVDNPNHKYINSAIGNRHRGVHLVDEIGCTVNDDVTTANMFQKEFANNFSPLVAFTLNAPSPNQRDQIFNASFMDTYTALTTSKSSSAGPDGISGRVLRNLSHILTLPISIIFQQSLAQGIFPSAWKVATFIPIHKKGARHSASTYRPISLCLTMRKALERIAREQLLSAIVKTKPLYNLQHGFFNGRLTLTNLLCAENITADAINFKKPYDIIIFDFSRAFDRVPHHLLFQDLNNRSISGKALERHAAKSGQIYSAPLWQVKSSLPPSVRQWLPPCCNLIS